jgi:hypothetical protein
VHAVCDARGVGERGKLIATMTVLDESDGYQHANATYPVSLTLPHERVSADHDSIGLFQQRPAWWFVNRTDSLDQKVRDLMDDKVSTTLFLNEMVGVPSWQTKDPWVVCQLVQRSGFLDGSNYRARQATAEKVLASGGNYFTNGGA